MSLQNSRETHASSHTSQIATGDVHDREQDRGKRMGRDDKGVHVRALAMLIHEFVGRVSERRLSFTIKQ